VFLKKGTFTVVEHRLSEEAHLLGDYCSICAEAEKAELRAFLERERQQLRLDADLNVLHEESKFQDSETLGDA